MRSFEISKLPYMPLFVDDYEAATAHLSFAEDGVYNRLLRLCWRTSGCSIPADAVWIARRMRCEMNQYHELVEPVLKEFFTVEHGRIHQKRLRSEWAYTRDLSAKRAEAGRKGGGKSKTLKFNETS